MDTENLRPNLKMTKKWSTKHLFILSVICVIFFLGGYFYINLSFTHPFCRDKTIQSPQAIETKKSKAREGQNTHTKTSRPSFAFLGQASEGVKSKKKPHNEKRKIINRGKSTSEKNTQASGRSIQSNRHASGGNQRDIEGTIPDLEISLNGQQIQTIARKYGFLLVAATHNKILGKIIDQGFLPMTKQELSNYSKRGRSANALPNADRMKKTISNQLKIPSHTIILMYLVPLSTENYFIDTELKSIKTAGMEAEDVQLVKARYDHNLNVRITHLITKDSQTINISQ